MAGTPKPKKPLAQNLLVGPVWIKAADASLADRPLVPARVPQVRAGRPGEGSHLSELGLLSPR